MLKIWLEKALEAVKARPDQANLSKGLTKGSKRPNRICEGCARLKYRQQCTHLDEKGSTSRVSELRYVVGATGLLSRIFYLAFYGRLRGLLIMHACIYIDLKQGRLINRSEQSIERQALKGRGQGRPR